MKSLRNLITVFAFAAIFTGVASAAGAYVSAEYSMLQYVDFQVNKIDKLAQLDDDQKALLRNLFEVEAKAFGEIQEEHYGDYSFVIPAMISTAVETHTGIMRVLTPEQRAIIGPLIEKRKEWLNNAMLVKMRSLWRRIEEDSASYMMLMPPEGES